MNTKITTGLIIMLLLGATLIYITQRATPRLQSVSPAPPTVVNLIKYENTAKGYTLRYPREKFVRMICPDEELRLVLRTQSMGDINEINATSCARDSRYPIEFSTVSTFQEPKTDTVYEVKKETTTYGKYTATRYILIKKSTAPESSQAQWIQQVVFSEKGKTYVAVTEKQELRNDFNHMLETIKFN
jgi:hypothetical protein